MIRRILPLALLLAAAGCDPCSGLGTCTSPQVRYEGVLLRPTGVPPIPASDIRVKFVPAGGVGVEADSLFGTTNAQGRFVLEGRTQGEGEVVGDLWVYPPAPLDPVRIPNLRMGTSRVPGELRHLGEWKIPYPYLGFAIYLFHRSTGKPAVGVEVEFRRTGGVPVEPDTIRVPTDPRGYAVFRPSAPYGEVTGEIIVYLLPPYRPYVIPDFRMTTFTTERVDSIIPVGIGWRLPYSATVVWEGGTQPVANAEVEFRRTGGVPMSPERFIQRTDQYGTVFLYPTPLAPGEVVGDLIIHPPAPGKTVVRPGFRLHTVDDTEPNRWLGYWPVPVADTTTVPADTVPADTSGASGGGAP